jgi:hypothetical protein
MRESCEAEKHGQQNWMKAVGDGDVTATACAREKDVQAVHEKIPSFVSMRLFGWIAN